MVEMTACPKRLFLSYGHDMHVDFARRLRDDLRTRGHQVWFDEDRLVPGHDWEEFIERGLDELAVDTANSFVILLLTEHSVRRPGGYCLNEITRALNLGLRIIPLMVVRTELPLSICRIQWLDMQPCIPIHENGPNYEPRLERLFKAIEEDQLDFEGTQQRLINHLKPLQFDAEILKHVPKFVGREWMFDKIRGWLAGLAKERVFWIVGAPGAGKTALSAVLSGRHREVAALHLCSFGHTQKSDPSQVVKSIAYQLTTQLPDYEARLRDMPDLESLAQEKDASTIFDHLILQPLAKLNRPNCPIVILIDALDEATVGGRNQLASFIRDHFPKTPNWLRLIITSRPEQAVKGPLQGLNAYVLDTESEANLDDLRSYLQRELKHSLRGRPDSDQLVELILSRSEGVFLYIERFCHDIDLNYLSLDRPEDFPQGLGGVFLQFFERQFPDREEYRKNVRPALRVILAAVEPLPAKTVGRVLGWQNEELRDFTRVLGSLFPITMYHGEEVIRPYHKSILDWLTARATSRDIATPSHMDPGDYFVDIEEGHRLLAEKGLHFWADDPYMRSHLAAHLFACQRLDDALALIESPAYLDAKVEAGLTFELADEISVLFKTLTKKESRGRLLNLLEVLARSATTALARVSIRSLAAIAALDPDNVSSIAVKLIEQPVARHDTASLRANLQAARVALEVVVSACHLQTMEETVRRVVLAASTNPDSNVRSLAAVSITRLEQKNYALGMNILHELARRCVRFGVIQPQKLEVFAGCELGLFFDRFDDEKLVSDLKALAGGLIDRIWGLKFALWLAPKVMATLLASVSDEYNPANLPEIRDYKRLIAANPNWIEPAMEMIEFIDPAHGTSEEFMAAVQRFRSLPWPTGSWFATFPLSCALISRSLNGEGAALEANFEIWETSDPQDHMLRQDFMYRMRLIQVGRRLKCQPRLDNIWTKRVEIALREFFTEQCGVFRGSNQHSYALGGATFGLVFLSHQSDDGRVPVLDELIQWATTTDDGQMLRWAKKPRNRQPDMLLARMLEFVGAEIGSNDQRSREVAFQGIRVFLEHSSKFDDPLWKALAAMLTRMSHCAADDVARFLTDVAGKNEISGARVKELRARMNRVLPKEGIGSVIGGTHSEAFFASVYCEPKGTVGGKRRVWQEFLRKCNSTTSLSATLRFGAQTVLQQIGKRRQTTPVKQGSSG